MDDMLKEMLQPALAEAYKQGVRKGFEFSAKLMRDIAKENEKHPEAVKAFNGLAEKFEEAMKEGF